MGHVLADPRALTSTFASAHARTDTRAHPRSEPAAFRAPNTAPDASTKPRADATPVGTTDDRAVAPTDARADSDSPDVGAVAAPDSCSDPTSFFAADRRAHFCSYASALAFTYGATFR
jgi:hypothetical protein